MNIFPFSLSILICTDFFTSRIYLISLWAGFVFLQHDQLALFISWDVYIFSWAIFRCVISYPLQLPPFCTISFDHERLFLCLFVGWWVHLHWMGFSFFFPLFFSLIFFLSHSGKSWCHRVYFSCHVYITLYRISSSLLYKRKSHPHPWLAWIVETRKKRYRMKNKYTSWKKAFSPMMQT